MQTRFKYLASALAALAALGLGLPQAQAQSKGELKIALIAGKTGPLEAYAKQTETGLMMGLEYAHQGNDGGQWPQDHGHREGRPAQGRRGQDGARRGLCRRQGRHRDRHDRVARSRWPCCRSRRNKKVLIVEPAVADAITGDKWNKYIFRTARNSTQDAYAANAAALDQGEVSIATLAQDNAFGRDGVAVKDAFKAIRPNAKVVFEEYAPQNTTDFTAGHSASSTP